MSLALASLMKHNIKIPDTKSGCSLEHLQTWLDRTLGQIENVSWKAKKFAMKAIWAIVTSEDSSHC